MHDTQRKRITVTPAISASTLALLAVIVANAALAFGPWFVRLSDTGPVASAFWRITLAAPLLVGAALSPRWRAVGTTPRRLSPSLWWMIALGGVCFAADLASWHLGILRTTLANATLLGNVATLMFPLYGFVIMRAWPTRLQGFALALAAIGAGLLLGRSYQLDPQHLVGDLLCLLAGLLYTAYFILMARVRAVLAPLPALALSTAASIVPLLCFALLLGEKLLPTDWAPLIGLALVSQIVGQGLMIYGLGRLPPLTVGLALLVQPMVGTQIGWIVYHEQLGWADGIGTLLVAIALVLVSRRARA
ncbi:MAG: DMT family transporter [Pseudomonadota bacterium]|jgi:drug/metabolite transporter (DMT)-like permease